MHFGSLSKQVQIWKSPYMFYAHIKITPWTFRSSWSQELFNRKVCKKFLGYFFLTYSIISVCL